MATEIDSAKYEMTPLLVLASKGEMQSILELLATGTNVNATDNRGGTALMYAAMNKHIDVVRILLERGADPNLTTNKGSNAVDFALLGKSNDIADVIIEHIKKHANNKPKKLNFIERIYEEYVSDQ